MTQRFLKMQGWKPDPGDEEKLASLVWGGVGGLAKEVEDSVLGEAV